MLAIEVKPENWEAMFERENQDGSQELQREEPSFLLLLLELVLFGNNA